MGSGSSKDGSSSDETYNIHGELVDIPESFAQVSIFKAFCLFMSPLSNQTRSAGRQVTLLLQKKYPSSFVGFVASPGKHPFAIYSQLMMAGLTLYGYYRSSCSARLRIALDLKDIAYKPVYVDLNNGEQFKDEYVSKNPSRSVPTLMIDDTWGIPQSMAALAYLEEAYSNSTPLLPGDAKSRADVRTLTDIIAIDIQQPTNDRVIKRAESLGADQMEWSQNFTETGLKAFETVVSKTAGKYCCGDMITLADVCLVPALWNAEKFGVSLEPFPTICRVYAVLKDHPSFRKSHWQQQPDCPEEPR